MADKKRKYVDCRDMPSEKNCSVYIAGTEDEVLSLAVRHAVQDHGHQDSPELRDMIRKGLKDEAPDRARPAASASGASGQATRPVGRT